MRSSYKTMFSIGMACVACFSVPAASVGAATMTEQDPNGFYGIRWGADLADIPDLAMVDSSDRLQTYEWRKTPPLVGDVPVNTLRFVALEGQFARAFFRYSGQQTHTKILAYLEQHYGQAERMPGSMMRGLNQQFTWRGAETEVNLTYQSHQERGTVFVESRTLAPRFNDVLPESAF